MMDAMACPPAAAAAAAAQQLIKAEVKFQSQFSGFRVLAPLYGLPASQKGLTESNSTTTISHQML